MMNEIMDLENRICRLEDNMLRCKDFNEQLRMSYVLRHYRNKLQTLMLAMQKNSGE